MIVRVPLQPTSKPGLGVAPTSHCHWVVGGVRMQPRPLPSVRPRGVSALGMRERVTEGMSD